MNLLEDLTVTIIQRRGKCIFFIIKIIISIQIVPYQSIKLIIFARIILLLRKTLLSFNFIYGLINISNLTSTTLFGGTPWPLSFFIFYLLTGTPNSFFIINRIHQRQELIENKRGSRKSTVRLVSSISRRLM